MRDTHPRVYLVTRPSVDLSALRAYLTSIDAEDWLLDRAAGGVGVRDHAELLVEVMGRLCYRSWKPGMNPNVTKVRTDRDAYLRNIVASLHGSVLEHANYSFIFADVSRVFTHELITHRAGTAKSQESLRFVRLTDIPFEHPDFVRDDPELRKAADDLLARMEWFQDLMAHRTEIDEIDPDSGKGMPFAQKKIITSGMRRYAPDGVATTIGWTCNIRALRHAIEVRTAENAEDEIRRVFDLVAKTMVHELPSLMGDFVRLDSGAWVPEHRKV